jgi:hypothetical protein
MAGAAIAIDDASATDTVLSVKERVFAVNDKMPVHRQRLVYQPGPYGMEALADDETLGGAGVAPDGTAILDVLLDEPTAEEVEALGKEVCCFLEQRSVCVCVCFLRPKILQISTHTNRSSYRACVDSLTSTTLCERLQLIDTIYNGKAADVDRLIKCGAKTETKDYVRISFSFQRQC